MTNDLSQQIGVIVAESANAEFATLLQKYAVTNGYAVIDGVSKDSATKQPQPQPSTARPIRARRSSGG